jgi:mono/diheme cytochrome c family protein
MPIFSKALALVLGAALVSGTARAGESEPARLYTETIAPLFKEHCYGCHSASAEKVKGGLRLDSLAGLLAGGDSGPAVVPGKLEESLLIQALRHEGGLAMPPKKPKLPEAAIRDVERWIAAGVPGAGEPAASAVDDPISAEARAHWAFQPVKKPRVPHVRDRAWSHSPIDAFILEKLEARRWLPASEASRAELIRRLTFDLTGLPPAPDEIGAFLKDERPDAYDRVVDRLLDSPHYGERWAQHWLDVVRYAESEGYEYDRHVPDAWRYRDYVIESLNNDKPFDRFIIEQLAGDEIGPTDPECLTASIFHRLGPVRRNAGNPEIALSRNEVLTERTDILGAAFLGLTIGCARCHSHKLEPISQRDYYHLQAYLAATEEHNVVLAPKAQEDAWKAETQALREQIQRLQAQAKKAAGAERTRLTAEIEALEEQLPRPPATIPSTQNDFAHRTEIHVLRRGVWENKGEPVGPRPPSVLVPPGHAELPVDVGNPRTRLARWLASPEHPLTARVLINRLWQHHFGTGLVKTANDFGIRGDHPSHLELLDWLAATLVEGGWRLKPIHRLIVLSSTYRQSSRSRTCDAARLDPENRLLSRANRRRLTAEEIRDSMLAVSGRLASRAGGPSVMVPTDPELVQLLYKPSQWKVASDPVEYDRRSVYLIAKRNLRLPFFEAFDAPALLTSCPRRESSTHAPQALELLNGPLANDLAISFAGRIEGETGGEPTRIVERALLLALGRPPTARERERALEFLHDQPLKEFALAIFNLNEFLYVR